MNDKTEKTKEQEQQELSAFQELYNKTKSHLADIGDKVNADNIKKAIDKAVDELKDLGEHSAETIKHASGAVKKEIKSQMEKLEPNWEEVKTNSSNLFNVWRDRSTVFLGHATKAMGEWLQEAGTKLEHQIYHTGELTAGGSFECTACGEKIELKEAGHMPPCPKCMKTEFKRT